MSNQEIVEEAIEVLEVYGNAEFSFISPFGAGRVIGASDDARHLASDAWIVTTHPDGLGASALEAAQRLREGRRVVNGSWTRKVRT